MNPFPCQAVREILAITIVANDTIAMMLKGASPWPALIRRTGFVELQKTLGDGSPLCSSAHVLEQNR